MVIIGITHLGSYNQAACIIVDGKFAAWAEEERFNRFKHSIIPEGMRGDGIIFPKQSIRWCLEKTGVTMSDVNHIAVGHSAIETISRHFKDPRYCEYANFNWIDWQGNYPKYLLKSEYEMKRVIQEDLLLDDGSKFPLHKLEFYGHHESHAVSAVIPSGMDECNYMTMDGEGGEKAGLFGYWDGNEFNDVGFMNPLHSVGGFYEDFTQFLGFKHHSSEGKTMGLACYGEPDYELIPREIYPNKGGFLQPIRNWYSAWIRENLEGTELQKKIHNDIMCPQSRNMAATVQALLEEIVDRCFERLQEFNYSRNLCLAGGTFLNCTSNGKLARKVDNIFIQPGAHDSGTALGAAILCYRKHMNEWPVIHQTHAYYGRDFTVEEVQKCLEDNGLKYESVEVTEKLPWLIHENKVVGYFQGRSEVGPRALCHRSILANPTIKENLDRVNKIKKREWWRPLAQTIAEEHLFDITDSRHLSPFMLMACQVKDEWKHKIPAVTHVDGSCRPQSVSKYQNGVIHKSLMKFKELSGVPVFLNTSFNIQEPLVDSPQDAVNTFIRSDLDALLIEGQLVLKEDIPKDIEIKEPHQQMDNIIM